MNLTCGGGSSSVFSKRVEGLIGQLMRLVDDVNLEAIARGPVAEVLDYRAGVIDFAIGGAVDFGNIERAAGANFETSGAFAARIRSRTGRTIEASREDARGGGLTDPANSGEQKRMRDSAALQRLGQGSGDMLLADQLAEAFRTPFASEHEM